ncbi:uncharacterized protein V1516DRAFT_670966 [Lipomyces oligophaga]|uniref:uncharacterized protein n=1 Tax=Lipomyces oligophaga TaxID=45792 RepID=UPI0034CF09E5
MNMVSSPVACPVPPCSNGDVDSFGFTSARERWPIILAGVIDDISRTTSDSDGKKAEEGKELVRKIDALRYDVERDHVIQPLEDDGKEDIAWYNSELKRQGPADGSPMTWGKAPWLYSECYLYRAVRVAIAQTNEWKDYDVFARQKLDAFKGSERAVVELAVRYKALSGQLDGNETDETLELLFREFIDISLWGNATDLSLLTNLTLDQLQSLQGKEARQASEKNILVNDVHKAWAAVHDGSEGRTSRIDIVLDNAGFEFYTDVLFGLFMLDSGIIDTVVFHPKTISWFVSDVMPVDLAVLVNALKDTNVFGHPSEHAEELAFLCDRLVEYSSEGRIIMRESDFWTTPYAFWEIRNGGLGGGHELWEDLKSSRLVIFKGDLNYRKLTYDGEWPKTTSFSTAIGPLASAGLRLFSLRTCKADVVVGLETGRQEKLEAEWTAMGKKPPQGWSWSGKWAVMPFTDGKSA